MFDKQKGRHSMNRKIVLILILSLCSFSVFAGDVAEYVNLGFSENSEYFMFGLYGIEYNTSKPYAGIYTVKVADNVYARNGVLEETYTHNIQPGQDGSGALYNLMAEKQSELQKYNINHLQTGRIVYLLINGAEPKSTLEFRDFKNNGRYKVSLVQQQFGTEKEPSASFYIDLTVTDKTNKITAYKVGLPDFKRKNVLKYRIKQIMFAPNEKSLVFVIEKEIVDGTGPSIRYMVETVNLD